LCTDGPVKTLVDLALAPEHRRGHGALYDVWGADTRFRLLTSAFCMRSRCRSVLVDQAAEDFLAPQPSLVTISGSCR
jgi:hypothetical protein